MSVSITERVKKHRSSLKAAGMRPIQIWIPDTKSVKFTDECKRQSKIIAKSDLIDTEALAVLDAALDDVNGWR